MAPPQRERERGDLEERSCRGREVGAPTNIASVNLAMGCPNARAGVGIVGKKTLRATKFRPLR